jgi:hypothetical protein
MPKWFEMGKFDLILGTFLIHGVNLKPIISGLSHRAALRVLCLFLTAPMLPGIVQAQDTVAPRAAEGYVTAVEGTNGFAVNGNVHVTTNTATRYMWFSHDGTKLIDAPPEAIQPGIHVEVLGDRAGRVVSAQVVRMLDEGDRDLHGFGLVDKVMARGPEPVFRADGYLLRVAPGTSAAFKGELKSLDDVTPGDWVQYEGKRDQTGVVVATRVEFAPGKAGKIDNPKLPAQGVVAPGQNLVDSDGELHSPHTKYRMNQMGNVCGWHVAPTDAGLQERVLRVGNRLVPAFQRQMADNERAKIHFRFYVVDEPQFRSEFGCSTGLILLPKQVVGRLKNDDQLAAVIADGVAANLAFQSAKLVAEYYAILGVEFAGDFVAGVSSVAFLGLEGTADAAIHELDPHLMRERARMALGLMADAGYDPWQAPEAWRLLAPKKLPADTTNLKFPNISGYQLAILAQQYKRDETANGEPSESTSATN